MWMLVLFWEASETVVSLEFGPLESVFELLVTNEIVHTLGEDLRYENEQE